MWNIILIDIIPIFVIMLLGYGSGKTKAFSADNARLFNKLVLDYALPAALFVSIVKGNRQMLVDDLKLTIISAILILGVFMFAYFSCYKFFKHTKSEAGVCALIAGSPTIGFLGFAILGPIFGNTPSEGLVIAIVSIITNAIAIPIGLALINSGIKKDSEQRVPPTTHTTATLNSSIPPQGGIKGVYLHFISWAKKYALIYALIQPVSWVPILAMILVLAGVDFPEKLDYSFNLIANANSGVAVFAAGLTLSGLKFQLNGEVLYNTFVKLILMPGLLLLAGWIFKMEPDKLQMLVLAGALPPAFSGIIISSRYQLYVRTGTSSLAISLLLFMATAPLWIWLSQLVAATY